MFFIDSDILSAFVKVGGIKYLKTLFHEVNISQSIYEELARAKRAIEKKDWTIIKAKEAILKD